MKIGVKIQLLTTVWLILILVLVNTAVYTIFSTRATTAELNRLMDQTENMVEAVRVNPDSPFSPAELLRTNLPANGLIRVVNEQGEELLIVTKRTDLTALPVQYSDRQQTTTFFHADGEQIAVAMHPIIWSDGSVVSLQVGESLALIQENIRQLGLVLILSTLVVLLPVFIGSRVLGRIILQPIKAMIKTMEEIQRKKTFKQISLKKHSNDELAHMAATFNRMIELLQENFEKQQQFVSDASHELRTPLTVIESYAALLKRWGAKKPDVLEESVEAIHSEAQRMKLLTEQMLRLAKNDTAGEIDVQRVELVELCQDISRTLAKTYQREIRFISTEDSLYGWTDEQLLKQILFILLDNAMKYSEGKVVLQIGKNLNKLYIRVEDEGIGIPAEDLEKVFDRFYRVDKARNRSTGGSGLGLSIASNLVRALNGEIHLESEEGKGTIVTLMLPVPPEKASEK
ncbi:sensor histidine kinase [Bacillus horti]|uniref:Signal transduction histidine-protein kinase ArlS n=1 Tax=Caldalkalibacillus horti TaxID=77523 RepID=A0ABT9W434_9BACI|nr:ATP-binding protein [Bacillus horti]MDQ0167900.1 signal transduction histidine kinase [Bacillus horti]